MMEPGTHTVEEFCTVAEFRPILIDALKKSRGMRERDFVEGLIGRFDDFGAKMFLSDNQWDWLIRISEREGAAT